MRRQSLRTQEAEMGPGRGHVNQKSSCSRRLCPTKTIIISPKADGLRFPTRCDLKSHRWVVTFVTALAHVHRIGGSCVLITCVKVGTSETFVSSERPSETIELLCPHPGNHRRRTKPTRPGSQPALRSCRGSARECWPGGITIERGQTLGPAGQCRS